jgi:HEAT repeat protein
MSEQEQQDELRQMLESDDIEERLTAIQVLGETGDAQALRVLRERLRPVNQELAALITAVGKLKKKLGVK